MIERGPAGTAHTDARRPRSHERRRRSPGRRPRSLALIAYSLLWWPALPLAALYLLWRGLRQPEYWRHWRERFGIALRPAFDRSVNFVTAPGDAMTDAPVIWLHAVSVGETRAAAPLLRRLARELPRARFLLTHMTPTGRASGAELFADLGPRLRQRYLPYDAAFLARGFMRRERPALGLVLETEIWPNLFTIGQAAGVPMAIVNGRLSERSLRRGLRYRALMVPTVRSLCAVVAQTRADAARVARFGRDDVVVAGNLKFDQPLDEAGIALGRGWRRAVRGDDAGGGCAGHGSASVGGAGGRSASADPAAPACTARDGALPDGTTARAIVLAASTRDGEEAMLLDAWLRATGPRSAQRQAVQRQAAQGQAAQGQAATPEQRATGRAGLRPLFVIVPRHPQRFEEVAVLIERRLQATGWRFARRSGGDAGAMRSSDVLLGDSMGEMAAWYAMADVAIMGGSLMPFGAQNLIEPCAIGCPVILGPSTFNFAQAAADALACGAAIGVRDAHEAVLNALQLVSEPARGQRMAGAGREFAQAHRGATERTLAAIRPWLPRGAGQ